MSEQDVKDIIGRAMKEQEFAKRLVEDPDETLKEYDLTEDEKGKIKSMNGDSVGEFERNLDKRIMKKGDDWWVGSVRD